MDNKPNYWSILPANVRYDNELKPNEKILYSEITSLMNKDGYCYASNKYFSELYNVDTSVISRWISHLVDKGYLESSLVYKENSKEIAYRKLTTPLLIKKSIPIDYLVNTPIDYLVKDNNKDLSINNNIERYIEEIQQFKPVLNSSDYEIIKKIASKYSLNQVKQALAISKQNNAYSVKYLLQVLVNGVKEKSPIKSHSKVITPDWLNEDIQTTPMSEEELLELQKDFEKILQNN